MRRTVLAIVAALTALTGLTGLAAPVARADTAVNPKVVLVVGATHGTTSAYRSYMDQVYAEARKYSTNVKKVYSPNATWSAVKSALQGASIVVYMGHGNGFPSPYGTTLQRSKQNGFGLNLTAGNGDSNTRYYGESYVADEIRLAPNAIVILSHLCYASGNSEPGNAEPTLAVAKQRADNFAAGFIAAGAKAVIAEGHDSPVSYIRSLFTTNQTVDRMWRTTGFNNHLITFSSVRTPGYTVQMDPDNASSGYYRAFTTKSDKTLTTTQVTGARYASTAGDPSALMVPGAASAKASGARVFADATGTGTPVTTLPVDTRVRLDALAATLGDGSKVYEAHSLDGSVTGFVLGTELTPRDSVGPRLWDADAGSGTFSPNGDGRTDTLGLTLRFSESATWRVRFLDGDGGTLAQSTGSGSDATASWNGLVSGAAVPEGTYTYEIDAADGWGNTPLHATGTVRVDTTAPALTSTGAAASGTPPTFSPNGDGYGDSIKLGYSVDEAGFVDVAVKSSAGATVRSFSVSTAAGAGSVSWLGDTNAGATAPQGTYTVSLKPRDLAGNLGAGASTSVAVYTALKAAKPLSTVFYPQDNDAYAKVEKLSFTLASAATVTWQIVNSTNQVVATRYASGALAAGTYTWSWDGKTSTGAWAPRGAYRALLTATNGTLGTTVTSSTFVADAFRVTVDDTTPARGQRITITAITAEALNANARILVYQPGLAGYSATMAKIASTTYRITFTLKSGGSTGKVEIRVAGVDRGGKTNVTKVYLPIH